MLRYRCDFEDQFQNVKIYDSDDEEGLDQDDLDDLSEFM